MGIVADRTGVLLVADAGNDSIRRVTLEGVVTTLAGLADDRGAGSADGIGTQARFSAPSGVTVNNAGTVYVADTWNHTIRKITQAGMVTTLAGLAGNLGSEDGKGNVARFHEPTGLALDNAAYLYVADTFNHTIRKVSPEGVVTTIAGQADNPGYSDGVGKDARFFGPSGVAVDKAYNVYVADIFNHAIRKITPAGVVSTFAGLAGSPGSNDGSHGAQFDHPQGVAVDGAGNVYVADTGNHTIRKITPDRLVSTLAGLAGYYNRGFADGKGSAARFSYPTAVAVDAKGNVFVTDSYNQVIRKVYPNGEVTTLGGRPGEGGIADGSGSDAQFRYPQALAVDKAGVLYVADTSNSAIRVGYPAAIIQTARPSFGFRDGSFSFDLTGQPGKTVVVEASADLVNWLPLWTNIFAGDLNFSETEPGGTSRRFYRVRLP